MTRIISTKKYLVAFILTIIIFLGGIMIGMFFEDLRLGHSEQQILNEKVSLQSLQIQQEYIESGFAECESLNTALQINIDQLSKKMSEVIKYEKRAVFNQEAFNFQLQDYFLTEIQFYLLSQDIDEKCGRQNVKIIFFYDENQFDTQGSILDYLKKVFGDRVLIFSLDSNFRQEPMIDILLSSYDIEEFPSVVVEGTLFEGHTDTETLMKAICDEFLEIDGRYPPQCPSENEILPSPFS